MKATRRARTVGEMKAEALDELPTGSLERHEARIEETAIDLAPGPSYERGFVVQMYDCGILRDAWFFIDNQRVPLSGDEIERVLAAHPSTAPRTNGLP